MPGVSDTPASNNLAAKYRPRRFADVVGHGSATALLERAIAAGRLPAQLLFVGGSGLGKTTLARICAAALLCTDRADGSGDACGVCSSCTSVWDAARTHPDVVEFDAASYGGKDQIRDLASRAAIAPVLAPVRVYIIDEAHGLSHAGAQAFLKLLEEPPSHVVFMLCTTDPHKMLPTIRGRCVELALSYPTSEQLAAHLARIADAEGQPLPDEMAARIAEVTPSDVGVRGAVNALQRVLGLLGSGAEPDAVLSTIGLLPGAAVAPLTTAIAAGDPAAAYQALSELRARAADAVIRGELGRWLHRAFVAAASGRDPDAMRSISVALTALMAAPAGEWSTELAVTELCAAGLPASTPAPMSRPASPPKPSSAAPRPAQPAKAAPAAARPSAERASAVDTARPDPAPSGAQPVDADEFIALVAERDRRAGALLRPHRRNLTVDAAEVVLAVPAQAAQRLTAAAEHAAAVAGELGRTFRIGS